MKLIVLHSLHVSLKFHTLFKKYISNLSSDALREALTQNKELATKLGEALARKQQLEMEKDALVIELNDANDALKDALARLDASNAALNQVRSEMERRLREKDDEIDNIRWVSN